MKGATPAMVMLEQSGVEFAVHAFDHDLVDAEELGYGRAAAHALGVDESRVFKTLLAQSEKCVFYFYNTKPKKKTEFPLFYRVVLVVAGLEGDTDNVGSGSFPCKKDAVLCVKLSSSTLGATLSIAGNRCGPAGALAQLANSIKQLRVNSSDLFIFVFPYYVCGSLVGLFLLTSRLSLL